MAKQVRATQQPVAFLCHGSEDKEIVRPLARGLLANGVDVFFDEWDIGPGDSIRQRIDRGLGQCTHFVAVLTATSLTKPWVNAELDAGFVRRVEGQAKFIPLRLGLPVSALPPLLQGMHSPAIGDPEEGAASLAAFMHGVSAKPPLGAPPTAVKRASPRIGLSPAAQAIARVMVERSSQGRPMDPSLGPEAIMQVCDLGVDDMVDGADELVATGLVQKHLGLAVEHFVYLSPCHGFFATFDAMFGSTDPEADALRIASELISRSNKSAHAGQLAQEYGWSPRRMNPAAEFLVINDAVMVSEEKDPNWSFPQLMATPATRRFARRGN